MKTKATAWKITDHLKAKAEREAYLNAAIEDGDPEMISVARDDIARASGGFSE